MPLPSEAQLQEAATDLLSLCGWRWFHPRPARVTGDDGGDTYRTAYTGDDGYFDVTALKAGHDPLFVEVKGKRTTWPPEQQAWAAAAPPDRFVLLRAGDEDAWRRFEGLVRARPRGG